LAGTINLIEKINAGNMTPEQAKKQAKAIRKKSQMMRMELRIKDLIREIDTTTEQAKKFLS